MIDFKYNTKGFVDEEEFQKQIDIVFHGNHFIKDFYSTKINTIEELGKK